MASLSGGLLFGHDSRTGWAARGGERGGFVHGGGDGLEEGDLAVWKAAADEVDIERLHSVGSGLVFNCCTYETFAGQEGIRQVGYQGLL